MTDAFSFADDPEPLSAAERARRPGVSLADLVPTARFIGCDDIVATGFSDDPRHCREGDVFFARLSADGDGHDEVGRAVMAGAAGIVAERIVPTGGVPLCLVRSSDDTLARVAHALAGTPADRMRVIAVTGTSGKTTTAWLIASVLAEGGLRVGLLSDLGGVDPSGRFLPAADDAAAGVLPARLATLAEGGCTHVVVEVSSRMLTRRVLAGMACDTVVVPNLTDRDLDLHDKAAASRQLERRIVESLAHDGCLVTGTGGRRRAAASRTDRLARLGARVAADRPGVARLAAGSVADSVADCDVRIRTLDRSLHGRTFLLEAGGDVLPVAVDTPVVSFARNAACAAAVGLRHGVALEAVARGIEAVGSVPGRVERIDCGQDAAVFIDVASSSHGLGATLSSLRKLTSGRLAMLVEEEATAGLGRQAFGHLARRWCDDIVTVPAEMLDEDGSAPAVAAYARVDRLLARLRRDDCLLVVGRVSAGGGPRPAEAVPLSAIVSGWLRLAHPATDTGPRRLRAA